MNMRDIINLLESAGPLDAISDDDVFELLYSGPVDIRRTFRRQFNTEEQYKNPDPSYIASIKHHIGMMRDRLEEFTQSQTTVYRGVGQRFTANRKIGVHWTINTKVAADYGPVVLRASVAPDQIDWPSTMARGAFFWAPSIETGHENWAEQEISLIAGTRLHVDVLKGETVTLQGVRIIC
jgi:hypothetical protein